MAKKQQTKPEAPTPAIAAPPVVLGVVPKGVLKEIYIGDIVDPEGESDRMPREGDAERISETARSLREVGQLQPIMVEDLTDNVYVRVFGRRRLAAARLNRKEFDGPNTIMAIVVPPLAPDARRTIVAVENIQRQDLSPAEEHLAVAELTEMQAFEAAIQVGVHAPFGMDIGKRMSREIADRMMNKANQESTRRCANLLLADPKVRNRASELVAAMLAKPIVWVRDRMYIGRLDDKAREAVLHGRLPLQHAREISKVADPVVRAELAKAYAAGGSDSISDTEPGELDDLKHEVGQRLFSLGQVPWKLDAAFADKPACDGCPNNSTTNPGLFDHGGDFSTEMVGGIGRNTKELRDGGPAAGVCTLHTCYAVKLRTAKGAVSAAAKRIVDDGRDPRSDTKVVQHFVAPSALAAKVKDRKARKSGSSARKSSSPSPAKDMLAAEAREKYYTIKNALEEDAQREVLQRCKKDSVLRLCIEIFDNAGSWRRCWRDEDQAKAAQSPEFVRAIALLKKPSEEVAVKLRAMNEEPLNCEAWILPHIARAIGIKCAELPSLSDFTRKYKADAKAAEKAPKDKPAAKAKASSKKPAKASKAKQRTAADHDDDLMEPPEGPIPEGGDE